MLLEEELLLRSNLLANFVFTKVFLYIYSIDVFFSVSQLLFHLVIVGVFFTILNCADISELNLPSSCSISFPNGKDDLMNFEVSIKPDDGYYQLSRVFFFLLKSAFLFHTFALKTFLETHLFFPSYQLNSNGTFVFTFQVSPVYPHEAPKVKCKTKVGSSFYIPYVVYIST